MNKVTATGKGQDKTDKGEKGTCITDEAAPRPCVSVKVMSKRESKRESINQAVNQTLINESNNPLISPFAQYFFN